MSIYLSPKLRDRANSLRLLSLCASSVTVLMTSSRSGLRAVAVIGSQFRVLRVQRRGLRAGTQTELMPALQDRSLFPYVALGGVRNGRAATMQSCRQAPCLCVTARV